MQTQEYFKQRLASGIVRVTFRKLNGDIRVMECTKNMDLVPPSMWPKGEIDPSDETRKTTIHVFDISAQGWRSIILENVIEVAP